MQKQRNITNMKKKVGGKCRKKKLEHAQMGTSRKWGECTEQPSYHCLILVHRFPPGRQRGQGFPKVLSLMQTAEELFGRSTIASEYRELCRSHSSRLCHAREWDSG